MKNNKWRQQGTEGIAGSYERLAIAADGSWYGRRLLGDVNRVRLVPADAQVAAAMAVHIPEGWKTPADGVNRFSVVVPVGEPLTQALAVCETALKAAAGGEITVNQAGLARVAADVG